MKTPVTQHVGHLHVTWVSRPNGRHEVRYSFDSGTAHHGGPGIAEVHVDVDPSYVERFLRQLRDAREGDAPRANGIALFGALFPATGPGSEPCRQLLADLRSWRGPLVIDSDEAQVPWELLWDREHEPPLLGLAYPVGRRLRRPSWQTRPGRMPDRLDRALVVAHPTQDLYSSRGETEALVALLEEHGIICTVLLGDQATQAAVVHALDPQPDAPTDLFYFFGHVEQVPGNNGSQLILADGPFESRTLDTHLADGKPTGSSPPLVFINGCSSAAGLASMCETFMAHGAQIVVGTHVDVAADTALPLALDWHRRLLAGEPVGEALRKARLARREDPGLGGGAFALFGDPILRFAHEPEPDDDELVLQAPHPRVEVGPATTPQPPDCVPGWPTADLRGKLTPEASDVLQRAGTLTGDSRLITTVQLAAALVLQDGSALAVAADAAGLPRRAIADLLCETVGMVLDAESGAGRGTEVAEYTLSANTGDILAAAKALAANNGRSLVSVADLVEALLGHRTCMGGEILRFLGVEADSVQSPISDLKPASLFGEAQALGMRFLDPQVRAAVRTSWLIASVHGSMISSMGLLVGLSLTGSATLRRSLLAQGHAGETAVRLLFTDVPESTGQQPYLKHFSARTYGALEKALQITRDNGDDSVSDATLIACLLADPASAACQLLKACGVDPGRLADSLVPPS